MLKEEEKIKKGGGLFQSELVRSSSMENILFIWLSLVANITLIWRILFIRTLKSGLLTKSTSLRNALNEVVPLIRGSVDCYTYFYSDLEVYLKYLQVV